MEHVDLYERVRGILEAAAARETFSQSRIECMLDDIHCNGYAEPGYTDPECGIIICGDWNSVTKAHYDENGNLSGFSTQCDLPERLYRIFDERYGINCEWSDEWTSCHECGKLVRSSPDCYGWTSAYVILNDCELVCHECIQSNAAEYLESIEGKYRTALSDSLGITPEDYGYVVAISDMESGFHRHQTDDPKTVAKEFKKLGIERFLFALEGVGQFDVSFRVYVHESEKHLLPEDVEDIDTHCEGPSIAENAERALRSIPPADPNSPHGQYVKVDVSTGTAEVFPLDPEKFVKGEMP